jgi:hypothetical protein
MSTQTAAATADEAMTANRKSYESLTAKGFLPTTTNLNSDYAKVVKSNEKTKDIELVLMYFQYNIGTSLDCAFATGILRNSITYYISDLMELGLLGVVRKDKDRTTRYLAYQYSADPSKWRKPKWVQLKIWEG